MGPLAAPPRSVSLSPQTLGATSHESAGDGNPDPSAFPKCAVDLGLAAEALGAFAQVAQALAGAGGLGSVEAAAVVINLQDGVALVGVQRHPAGGRLGVAAHVREGLAGQLDHVAGPAGQLGRHLRVDLSDGQDPGALTELLDQPLEGLVELAVGEDAGAQAEDVVAQVADDPVQLIDGVLEAAPEVVVAGQQGRALEAQADREQGLDGPVVQLLGDPLAVLEDGQALELALEAAVLEGDRGLLAKVSTSCTSLSRSSGPPRPLATVRVPRMRPRTARGMNTAGPAPAATIGWQRAGRPRRRPGPPPCRSG